MTLHTHTTLTRALLAACPAPDKKIITTHISSVLLCGAFAYKLKKPVDLGFIDYTDLQRRRMFCDEELRLNGRLSRGIYLETVKITGSLEAPQIVAADDPGAALEYAVKMRRFDEAMLLDRVCLRGDLTPQTIVQLADTIADYHQNAARVEPQRPFGEAETIMEPIRANFTHLRSAPLRVEMQTEVEAISAWSESAFAALAPLITRRKGEGFVRECHGDMHLGNIVLQDGTPVLFDGIEFNDRFKWIDVASDLAFLLMDLEHRGLPPLANVLLNRYLENTGDYALTELLRFYQCYRAMVRAKVYAIARSQDDASDKTALLVTIADYLALARRYTTPLKPALILMHGFSGSGKSVCARRLAELTGAITLRSDIERRRLFGASSEVKYTAEATAQTFTRLASLSETIARAGFPVIVDATFLKAAPRDRFIQLAAHLDCPLHIVHTACPEASMFERIDARTDDPSDATAEVLKMQMASAEPLRESVAVHTVDTDTMDRMETSLQRLLPQLSV